MPSLIDQPTMLILEACRVEDNMVFLPPKLERPQYLKVNSVLEALGGKWNRKAKAHVFTDDPAEALDSAMLTGSYTRLQQELQYFPTPDSIISLMIQHTEKALKRSLTGLTVLEPSAGDGAIALRLASHGCNVICCEKHEPFREKLLAIPGVVLLRETDFLKTDPNSIKVDAVIANPPFTKQQDIDHVMHMIRYGDLKTPVVSVMASGVTFRDNSKTNAFKEELSRHDHEFHKLPEGSFKSSGTGVNTVLLVASKIRLK